MIEDSEDDAYEHEQQRLRDHDRDHDRDRDREQLIELRQDMKRAMERLSILEHEQKSINNLVNRGLGGGAALVGLGLMAGWVMSIGSSISTWFGKH